MRDSAAATPLATAPPGMVGTLSSTLERRSTRMVGRSQPHHPLAASRSGEPWRGCPLNGPRNHEGPVGQQIMADWTYRCLTSVAAKPGLLDHVVRVRRPSQYRTG